MKKFLVFSVVALATTLFQPAVHAADSHHAAEDIADEDFVRVSNTRLFYNIDSDTCKVTLKTRRNIRRITQRDSDGNIVKRWSTRKGESVRLFSDFDKFPVSLTEGTIKVKTGYKDRVKFQEIGDQFRADLTDCLTVDPEPVEPICPFATEILNASGGENIEVGLFSQDPASTCTLVNTVTDIAGTIVAADVITLFDSRAVPFDALGATITDTLGILEFSLIGTFDGGQCLSTFPQSIAGIPACPSTGLIFVPEGVVSDGVVADGTLTAGEARACAVLFEDINGQGCDLIIPD